MDPQFGETCVWIWHIFPSAGTQLSIFYMKRTSVQAAGRAACRLQRSRMWRCCCVGWPADGTQDLHGWGFLLGSPLQLDTETAVNHSHWSRVGCPFSCACPRVVRVQTNEWTPLTVHIKGKYLFYFNKMNAVHTCKKSIEIYEYNILIWHPTLFYEAQH